MVRREDLEVGDAGEGVGRKRGRKLDLAAFRLAVERGMGELAIAIGAQPIVGVLVLDEALEDILGPIGEGPAQGGLGGLVRAGN